MVIVVILDSRGGVLVDGLEEDDFSLMGGDFLINESIIKMGGVSTVGFEAKFSAGDVMFLFINSQEQYLWTDESASLLPTGDNTLLYLSSTFLHLISDYGRITLM